MAIDINIPKPIIDYNDLDNLPTLVTAHSELSLDDGTNPHGTTAADIGAVTSVDLTMPSAFTVTGNPITSAGTLAVAGAGVASQYVRGDGTLANFPSNAGGGSSQSFYLNGSVAASVAPYKQMSSTPVLGAGTNFTLTNTRGYIAQFLTDVAQPNKLLIPAGNWNLELYFNVSNNNGNPSFYVELYKYNGATFTNLATSGTNPEGITNGTTVDLYTTAIAVPQTTLLATDRLAIRVFVNTDGNRTVTLHTENSNLAQVITTFSTGIAAINGLTSQIQNLAVGTSGTDFGISSATDTHTFNLPTASAANRGALSSTDWSTFNGKQATLVSATNIKTVNGNSLLGSGDLVINARVQSVTSSATVTAVSTNDLVRITAQAVGLTLANPTGTFAEGQSLIFRIKDNGTARTIAYGANFRAIGVTLPTTTVINKTTYIGCIYNDSDTKFDIVGTCTEA